MATKQPKLLDVVKKFKDDAQELAKSTHGQVKELIVNTSNEIAKLAVNAPQIKKLVSKAEAEQAKYEKIFKDLQEKALDLYRDKAEKHVSDIKKKIDGYKKQAEKIYKDTVSKATGEKKTKSKVKPKARRAKRVRAEQIESESSEL